MRPALLCLKDTARHPKSPIRGISCLSLCLWRTVDCSWCLSVISDDREGGGTSIGLFGWLLFGLSWCLVAVTLPFSLCVLLKVPTLNRKQTLHWHYNVTLQCDHNTTFIFGHYLGFACPGVVWYGVANISKLSSHNVQYILLLIPAFR